MPFFCRATVLIYLLLLAVLIAACKKKKSDNTPPAQNASPTQNASSTQNASPTQNQNCRISKTESIEREEKYPRPVTFEYDDKGNLIKVVMTGDLIETYAYSKKSIVYEDKQKDVVFSETITYSLDDSGRIISADVGFFREGTAVSIATENITYKYTNDGYLSVITIKKRGYNTATYTYTWQNGNIASIEYAYGESYKVTTSFQYGSEVFPVNFVRFGKFDDDTFKLISKYFGKMSKNLPSRREEGKNITEYAYQKDDKGNIVKVSWVSKTPGKEDKAKSAAIYYNCK